MSDQYETRMEIIKKIHELRDLVIKANPPNTKGHINEIFKALRDCHRRAEDVEYVRICLGIILDHILHLNEKCNLVMDDSRLLASMKRLETHFEFYCLEDFEPS